MFSIILKWAGIVFLKDFLLLAIFKSNPVLDFVCTFFIEKKKTIIAHIAKVSRGILSLEDY